MASIYKSTMSLGTSGSSTTYFDFQVFAIYLKNSCIYCSILLRNCDVDTATIRTCLLWNEPILNDNICTQSLSNGHLPKCRDKIFQEACFLKCEYLISKMFSEVSFLKSQPIGMNISSFRIKHSFIPNIRASAYIKVHCQDAGLFISSFQSDKSQP